MLSQFASDVTMIIRIYARRELPDEIASNAVETFWIHRTLECVLLNKIKWQLHCNMTIFVVVLMLHVIMIGRALLPQYVCYLETFIRSIHVFVNCVCDQYKVTMMS